jgi:TorA maturation chaperone TorD
MNTAVEDREREVLAALRRAAIYRVLAAAFAYPAPDHLDELARLAAAVAPDAPPALRDGLARLAGAARADAAAALAAQHVALFDGAVRCPPYEGAYGPAQLGGKAAQLADIAAFYEAFGLEPAPGAAELPDHVAAELEFMAALAVKEAWALAEDDGDGLAVTRDAAAAFLVDHLGRWGASLAARIAGAGSPFHETAGGLVAAWLEIDAAHLGVAPAALAAREAVAADAEPFTCPLAQPAPGEG